MKKRALDPTHLPINALTRFWRSDRGLSLFSTLLFIAVFVVPPLLPPGKSPNRVMDVVISLLLISGLRALSERRFASRVLMPAAVVTITVYFASWLVPVARSLAILEAVTGPLYLAILLARLASLAVVSPTEAEPS